jgi:hypothetical protein
MRPNKKKVSILNGPHGVTITNRKRAQRYVECGRAQWVGSGEHSIRFIQDDFKHITTSACVKKLRMNAVYDAIERPLTLDECTNLPFVNPRRAYMCQPLACRPRDIEAARRVSANGVSLGPEYAGRKPDQDGWDGEVID